MMSCGESRKEPTRRTAILTPRRTAKLGTWNVRTLYETGKATLVAREMKRYGLTILGLCETHWTQAGQMRLRSGETILYSGHPEEDAPHTEGVALMLSGEAQKALIEWEGHGPRIIRAKFKTKGKFTCDIIQCYAPTNDKDDNIKEDFYNRLQSVLDGIGDRNLKIVIGDLNAKIGQDNTGYEGIMGKHGAGQMNDNGEKLANFCDTNQLVIGGSIFPHKENHKVTWVSPDLKTQNQIDHICISRRFRRSLNDVRNKRGADAASDHHLVVASIRLKLKKNWTPQNQRTKYNVSYLQDKAYQDRFKVAISNRFQVLQELYDEEEVETEQKWQDIKKAYTETCQEVLGRKTMEQNEWITPGTLQKVEERRQRKEDVNNAKTRQRKTTTQQAYSEKDKEVKKCLRQDKRTYIDDLATEAEQAAAQRDMKKLYDITRKLSGKYKQVNIPVKDKNGRTHSRTEDQLSRWEEHFDELLNRPGPQNPPDIQPADTPLEIDCSRPSKEEIKKAIKKQKSGKAAGPDNIPPEALKATCESTTDVLYDLFGEVWQSENVPTDWKEGHLIKLPKKGDLADCKNYRGIMLLSVPSKILNRIILDRIKSAIDPILREQQAGFRKERSCMDQIASLRIIVEQSIEWNSPLYINFVDYEKAFDSVDRNTLWKLLQHYGIPEKLINIIRNSYENMSCRVVHAGQLTKEIGVKTGVRQGCLLSPFLFLLVIDWIMESATRNRRNGIQWTLTTQLDDLDYADDLALLSHGQRQMQEKSDLLDSISAQTGLKIHRGKTKVMRINNQSEDSIKIGDDVLEDVQKFTYLGSIVSKTGGADEDIKARIGKARNAFINLKTIWQSKEISLNTKIRIFNSNVKTVLLYGSETWRITKANEKRLQVFVNSCLRRILGIRWPEIISNQELWQRTRQAPIAKEVHRRKWSWIGHTLRKPPNSIARQALTWNPQGKRQRGRPRNSWRRDIAAEVKRAGKCWREVEVLAGDRRAWRTFADGLNSSME